jgi:predicted ATPase
LGGFAIEVEGVPVDDRAWRLRKARTLVKVLALAPSRGMHREQAMELLWPELTASAAQNNLHQALHAARRVLGADGLTLEDGMLALASEVEVDVDLYETAAREGHPAEALELFAGELLPEDRYEPWAEARRAELTDLHNALCLDLAERQEPQAAITTLQRALRIDPLHEPAHRALMRIYEQLGRMQDALAQYQRLRSALRQALEADPDAETRALYRRLLAAGRSDPRARRGLPAELTTFVGRERELATIADELDQSRLLTLTGPGGSGKTRLAVAAAARADAAEGVVFVELASINDPDLVGDATATACGYFVPAQRTAAEALAEQLGTLETLLVLDTCEHVIEACASLTELLLERCSRVRILATSRERLRCGGERVWAVPGLEPEESLELFLARAREADPSFAAADLMDVERLCARLEGMPLALEMAAARVTAFSPAQIEARLDRSLDILSEGRRTALSRQKTLRATISWSHDLLDGEERVLFRRLAVFAGSFSLEAAADVCAGGAVEQRNVVSLLLRLVEKSLAVVDDAELARYRLLDTVRQFADECLTAAGEREAVEGRLRDWALALAADPPPLAQLELDHDNIRAALDSGLRRDPQGALALGASIWRFWLDRSYFTEGSRRLRAVLDATPEPTELRARTLLAAAALLQRCGQQLAAMAHAREAVALSRGMRSAFTADALHQLGLFANSCGTLDESTEACDEALGLAGEDPVRASILSVSALPAYYRGEFEESRSLLEQALQALESVPEAWPPFFDGVSLGLTILPVGPNGQLRPLHEETIFHFHRFDRARAVPQVLCNLAVLARVEGRREDAESLLGDALDRSRRLDDAEGEARALAALGNCARSFGEPDRALVWLDQAAKLRRGYGDRRAVGMTETAAALARALGGDLEGAEEVFARTHERFRAGDDAPAAGGALLMWGFAVEASGDAERAADLLAAGADVWARGLLGSFPGWGLYAAADALLNVGRKSEAQATITRAERLLLDCGDTRGAALCAVHPAAKTGLRGSKDSAS